MSLFAILLVVGLVLAIVSLFLNEPRATRALTAAVIVVAVALLLQNLGAVA